MTENLIRLFPVQYSSCKRPRRSKKQIPSQYWGMFIRCVEYPEGIFIDDNGQIQKDNPCTTTFLDDIDSDDNLSDSEFEKLPSAKKQKIINKWDNLLKQREFEEYMEDLTYPESKIQQNNITGNNNDDDEDPEYEFSSDETTDSEEYDEDDDLEYEVIENLDDTEDTCDDDDDNIET